MDAQEYAQLRQRREQWVTDDPRTTVTDILDSTYTLFTELDKGLEFSEEAWSALYFTTELVELLESAALRGGSYEIPQALLQQASHKEVPELGGNSTQELIAELVDEADRFKDRCVAAFRYLHEELSQTEPLSPESTGEDL